jgi:hypothetical protein
VVLNDLALFFALFLFQLIFYFLLHLIILRIYAKSNILYSSTITVFVSVLSVTLLSYFLVSGVFSSPGSYAVAAAGSGIAAVFACGLYTFLGPATADRSLACQLMVFLSGKPGTGCRREDLYNRFDSADFIEKRIEEFKKENIIEDRIESIILTDRGRRIAAVYIFILRSLGLRERNDYRAYFPND